MAVTKYIVKSGDGRTTAVRGQTVSMEYTGWLYDPSSPNMKGPQFDSSVDRGEFTTRIGVGVVIKGWEDGILGSTSSGPPMTLGEKATLIITSDYGYGARGFPGLIPAHATLVFDVELMAIF